MRDCKKNLRKMYYAKYGKKVPMYDDDGFEELEYKVVYEEPVAFKATLSTGTSNAEESPFGVDVSYDRIISTSDVSIPIDENSIIWVKNEPSYNDDGTVDADSADYKVAAAPLDGLNSVRIAIKKVVSTSSEQITNDDDTMSDLDNIEASETENEDGF